MTLKRVFPTPRGEYYAALATLMSSKVVSIQLQKPALKEQVKTEADATEGKGNKHNVCSLGRDNEHVVLL